MTHSNDPERLKVIELLSQAVDDTARKLFCNECHINPARYSVTFSEEENLIQVKPKSPDPRESRRLIEQLSENRGDVIALKCREWGYEEIRLCCVSNG